MQGAIQFGKFDAGTKKSNAFVIAEIADSGSHAGYFMLSVLVKTDGNIPPGKV
jgi:hypothetical protein